MRKLVFDKSDEGSTEKNVRMILDIAGDDPDLSVRSAAERCVQGLIDGTIPEEPFAIGEEFANEIGRAAKIGRASCRERV